jgi:hypothetical protein
MTAIQYTSGSSKAIIWQQHWQSSGWTQKAYCRENNLSHRQFLCIPPVVRVNTNREVAC